MGNMLSAFILLLAIIAPVVIFVVCLGIGVWCFGMFIKLISTRNI